MTGEPSSPVEILLVDDVPENLLTLAAVLENPEYRLIQVSSGADALRYLLTSRDCAVILMDVQMPDMDGFETAELIKTHERSRDIPIIFLTAIHKDETFVYRGYRTGAVDYLFKPFDADILRSKVAVFAELYRKRRELIRQAELIREGKQQKLLAEVSRVLSVPLQDKPDFGAVVQALTSSFARAACVFVRDANEEWELQTGPSLATPGELGEAVATGKALRFRRLGSPSTVVVSALMARGMILGALVLELEQGCGDDELETVGEAASRLGIAMENSLLFEKAQAAIRARDEFLSVASHELKTPLTPLKLQTQSLLRAVYLGRLGEISTDRLTRMIQMADRQLDRLSALVEDLLDVSRINTGRLQLRIEEFDLVELVNEVVEHFEGQLRAAGSDCRVLAHEPVQGHWDRFRVEQVIVNLLVNAIKYGPGQPIDIELGADGDQARLTVRDRGIGIEEKDQARIFGLFERAVPSSHFGGLGLGLTISHQIIEAHGGSIRVESQPGKGARFIVELPRAVASGLSTKQAPEHGEQVSTKIIGLG